MKRVYVIHGWTYSLDRWQDIIAQLKQNDVEPIMLKVPGLTEASDRAWTTLDYVTWLERTLAKIKQPVTLIGHSNGGRIALNYALRHPNRVKQLILIDSAGIYHNESSLQLKRKAFWVVAKVGKTLTKSPKLRRLLYKVARAQDYEQAPPNMRQTLINVNDSDRALNLAQIAIPTTLIWGEADRITPLADGQKMNTQIAGSKLHVIKDARHAPFESHAHQVGQLILGALR